jgi:hypothetical protein
MREAHLSDTGYELKLTLKNYKSSLCNGENILDDLEERLTGARDKSENRNPRQPGVVRLN